VDRLGENGAIAPSPCGRGHTPDSRALANLSLAQFHQVDLRHAKVSRALVRRVFRRLASAVLVASGEGGLQNGRHDALSGIQGSAMVPQVGGG
jgi:hypothetical protein